MGFDPEKKEQLLAALEPLGGVGAGPFPVVPHSLFFDGNHDSSSIGGNLTEHPGVEAFRRLLERIATQPEVAGVWVEVRLVADDEWPFSKRIFIVTGAAPHRVEGWVAPLQPVGVAATDWTGERPPGAPDPGTHAVFEVLWG
ncbi:MAG: hypothetical protein AAGF12_29410 [Myxococcota bacterium]